MSLVNAWTSVFTTSGSSKTFTIPDHIDSGTLLALALGRGGSGVLTSLSDIGSNSWVIEKAGAHSNGTFNGALAVMRVASAISAGATFTATCSATASRWAGAFGVFDGVVLPQNKQAMASPISGATPQVDVGPTPSLAVPRALVLTGVAMTNNGYPIGNKNNGIASQIVTTVGSSDRGAALLYKYEGGYEHTSSILVNNSSTSWSESVAYESDPLPDGSLAVMTDTGERSAKLYIWQGGVEVPVTTLERSS